MIKARSYVNCPQAWKNKFKIVIEAWKEFVDVEVIEYKKGIDSCEILAENIGIDYSSLSKPKKSNSSLSIEQMLLLEIFNTIYKN